MFRHRAADRGLTQLLSLYIMAPDFWSVVILVYSLVCKKKKKGKNKLTSMEIHTVSI